MNVTMQLYSSSVYLSAFDESFIVLLVVGGGCSADKYHIMELKSSPELRDANNANQGGW